MTGLVVPVYLLLAMRRVYRQGWGATTLKTLLVFTVYVFVVLHYAASGLVRLTAG